MHIVLFGGSFNPPHLGHQIVLTQALELIPNVDEIWLVPDYYHTFAKNNDYAPAPDRLAMCRLLIEPANGSNAFDEGGVDSSHDSVNSLLNVSSSNPLLSANSIKNAFGGSGSDSSAFSRGKAGTDRAPAREFLKGKYSPRKSADESTARARLPFLGYFFGHAKKYQLFGGHRNILGKQESIDNSGGTPKNKQVVRVETYNLDHKTSGDSIITVQALKQQYPEHNFSFLIGSDNLKSFTKWGSWEALLEELPFFVYPRAGFPFKPLYQNMTPLESPLQVVTNISSTLIRNRLKQHLPIHHLVPKSIESYIQSNHLYLG